VPSHDRVSPVPAASRSTVARWQRSRLAAQRTTDSESRATPLLDDRRLAELRARLDGLHACGRLDRVRCDPHLTAEGIHLAATNFRRAVRHVDDPDVAVVFLYQSVVNTADTVLHCLEYHARDYEGHKLALATSVDLLAALQDRSRSRLMATTSDRLRRRRHEALYLRLGVMTPADVRTALDNCRQFLPRLWTLVGGQVGILAAVEAAVA
jgi:hypothetical protein